MGKLTGKELANQFGDAVNNFNFNADDFVQGFKRQHRTLQQSMIRAMLGCIEAAASDDYNYDGRNEASHKTCKQLIEGWKVEKVKQLRDEDYRTGYWNDERVENYLNSGVKPSNLPTV